MALSDNIRSRREDLGMSMQELADKIGIAYQQIQKYERSMSKPQPETFVLLARALGTTCEKLVDGDREV